VIVKKAKINLKKCPVCPERFVILNLESEKNFCERRAASAPFVFGEEDIFGPQRAQRITGWVFAEF
jgi:uncharacterized Fe-S radical SAM superfamily protein PflX